MTSSPATSLNQIISFLQIKDCSFSISDKKERNKFIRATTWKLKYKDLKKKAKGLVIRYFSKIFGLSRIQSKRLALKSSKGALRDPKTSQNSKSFERKYTHTDIVLLAEFDNASNYPNGFALKANLRRMMEVFHDKRFIRLAYISHGHIYNLRKSVTYQKYTLVYQHTKPVFKNEIGVREKPNPLGPGYLRVDSVHGGEFDGKNGVYYINLVDELTQFEVIVCIEGISERFLSEVWEDILDIFPFKIIQFHSDNGSEFINQIVAGMLNKLNIRQTKSRPRHSTDNGLVETKNGWVIRKRFGYAYVEAFKAPLVNDYLKMYFNEYINFHRACAFPTRSTNAKGKVRIEYKEEDYKTPYAKLKEIDPEGKSLKIGLSYEILDTIANRINDFDSAKEMSKEYINLLKRIR